MYFFSDWFQALTSHAELFNSVIYESRGCIGWQDHKTHNGITFKSLFHSYKTKSPDDCLIESHRKTIDLQYCYSGGELIRYDDVDYIKPVHNGYDQSKDKDLCSSSINLRGKIHLTPKSYVLFKPEQLHQPQEFDGVNSKIEKIVLKLPYEILT